MASEKKKKLATYEEQLHHKCTPRRESVTSEFSNKVGRESQIYLSIYDNT